MTDQDADIDRLQEALDYYRQLSEELSATTLQQDHTLARLRHQLKQKRRSFSILAELQQSIRVDTPLADILETTVQSIYQTLAMDKVLVLGPVDQEECFRPRFWAGFETAADEQLADTELWLPWQKACADGHLLVNSSASSTPFIASIRSTFELPYFICVPIQTNEEFIGLLIAGRAIENRPYPDRLGPEDVNALKAIASLITVAVRDQEIAALKAENQRKEVELQKAAELEEAYSELEDTNQKLKAAQNRLKEQAEKLRRLDKQKSRFFTHISHEFRTPLTLIIGPLEDALEGRYGSLPDDLEEAHRSMLSSARRLLRLTDQLLDLAKLDHGSVELHRQERDLIAFVRETVRRFSPLAERRNIRLRFTPDLESLPAPFDSEQLEKVLANLLSNALKFTPKQGKVWVTVRERMGEEQPAAEIVVKDTGPGLAEAEIERIFDRFQRLGDETHRNAGEGSGIGLTLAKQLTELHGGQLLVESKEGFGSTFTVRIPLQVPPEELDKPEDEADPSEKTGSVPVLPYQGTETTDSRDSDVPEPTDESEKALVLLVEDHSDVRAHLRNHLEGTYKLITAGNGREGLEQACEHQPDLVIADIMMPEMNGYELIDALKADDRLKTIPILILTARAESPDLVNALDRGADDFVSKPFEMKEVQARIKALLRTRRTLRQQYSQKVEVTPSDVLISSEEVPFVEQVIETIEKHLSDSTFGTSRLAEALDLSRRHLTRRVKAATGETPGDLLRRLRLERAAQLLQETSQEVSAISRSVGFSSPSHFSKTFQQQFGASPSDFRENGS